MNWTTLTVLACLTLVSGDSLDRARRNLSFSNILSNYFNKYPVLFKKKRNNPVSTKDNPGVRRIFPYNFVPPHSTVDQEKIKSDNNIKNIQNDGALSSFNINNLRSSNIITSGNLIKFRNDPSKNKVYYKESASNMVQSPRDHFITQVNVPDRSLVVDKNRKNFAGSIGAPSLGNDLKVMSSVQYPIFFLF